MRKLPLPSALALLSLIACAAACGGDDNTPSQPGNSTTDSGADVTVPDASAPDATGIIPLPDAAPEASPATPDAGTEASVTAPEPTPEAGPADAGSDASPDATVIADAGHDAGHDAGPDAGLDAPAPGLDLDACSLPDGGIPNLPINDSGATTMSCLACIDTTCATQAAACNGDCACAGDVVALLICTASGQSAQSCLTSAAASGAFTPLALCVGLFCTAPCGI